MTRHPHDPSQLPPLQCKKRTMTDATNMPNTNLHIFSVCQHAQAPASSWTLPTAGGTVVCQALRLSADCASCGCGCGCTATLLWSDCMSIDDTQVENSPVLECCNMTGWSRVEGAKTSAELNSTLARFKSQKSEFFAQIIIFNCRVIRLINFQECLAGHNGHWGGII